MRMAMEFPTQYEDILARMHAIDPVAYAQTRNYVDGAVSYLSPYISRGVLSTRQVYDSLRARGYSLQTAEKFISELAWRDYWQQVWVERGDAIDGDLLHPQPRAQRAGVPDALVHAETGIDAIDDAVRELMETGYMHNHVRMYAASIACNIARCHWLEPARWMHYHLLDADWASNALSWQWVAGANSNTCYVANQENINTYCRSAQRGTFLDVSYSMLEEMEIPSGLERCSALDLVSPLPAADELRIDMARPTLVYTLYNLDPIWHAGEECNRVLLVEPELLARYPLGPKPLQFALQLAKNIADLQLYVGSFFSLKERCEDSVLYYRDHPTQRHYHGRAEARPMLANMVGYVRSFSKFWRVYRRCLLEGEPPT